MAQPPAAKDTVTSVLPTVGLILTHSLWTAETRVRPTDIRKAPSFQLLGLPTVEAYLQFDMRTETELFSCRWFL